MGNRLWVVPVTDPDGYRVEFSSPTDAPEESTGRVGGPTTGRAADAAAESLRARGRPDVGGVPYLLPRDALPPVFGLTESRVLVRREAHVVGEGKLLLTLPLTQHRIEIRRALLTMACDQLVPVSTTEIGMPASR